MCTYIFMKTLYVMEFASQVNNKKSLFFFKLRGLHNRVAF